MCLPRANQRKVLRTLKRSGIGGKEGKDMNVSVTRSPAWDIF